MRDFNHSASLALLAFMGLAGFTACSSDDATAVDPSVNPDAAVKTTFTLSVGVPQGTRVSTETAQAQSNPVFRGIDNITLIPFGLAGSLNAEAPVQSSSERLGININLPGTNGSASNAFEAVNGSNIYNKVYSDVSLPQGTTAFLFYGKAVDNAVNQSITTDADYHKYGSLVADGLTGQPDGITFSPRQVNQLTATPAKATTIASYLTTIANTSITVGTTNVSWSTQNSDANPLYNLYTQFIQNQSGSSNDVRIMLQTLYTTLSQETSPMATAIINNILTHASVSNGTLTLSEDVAGYPADNYLPDGVALVSWNPTNNQFDVNTSGTTPGGELTTKPSDLVYPANLQYYVNTNIRTSNTDQADALQNAANWEETLTGARTAFDGNQVTTSTQTVALLKKIQYAVGRLDLTLKESATMNDHDGKPVAGYTGTTSNFPISAIFVGGQRVAKYDFTPKDASSSATQYTIYDNVGPDNWYAALPSTASPEVAHTLALETPANDKVRIAVELTNNSGSDFKGQGGQIIYNGAKFYLVADLDPTATSGVAQPEGSTTMNQVFKQDYVTKANLTISQNTASGYNSGLGAAYNILPDLRNPRLSLGLSVDLSWQNGLTFNVDM